MSREDYADEQELLDAVNDEQFERPRSTGKANTLKARRQVEALLEERRLRRAIDDDYYFGIDDTDSDPAEQA